MEIFESVSWLSENETVSHFLFLHAAHTLLGLQNHTILDMQYLFLLSSHEMFAGPLMFLSSHCLLHSGLIISIEIICCHGFGSVNILSSQFLSSVPHKSDSPPDTAFWVISKHLQLNISNLSSRGHSGTSLQCQHLVV